MSAIDSISSPTDGTGAIDHSYSRYDAKSGPDTGVGTMSFDDFIDMVNPLQHIPIVSSVYRAVTGETINPLSRIAGDTLYGGVLGLASAGMAAIGAVGDEIFAANNDGKGTSQTIVAALFGSDDDKNVQLAATDSKNTGTPDAQAQTMQVASLQTPARQSPILDMPDFSTAAATIVTTAAPVAAAAPITSVASDSTPQISVPSPTATAIEAGKGLAIDRSKAAYGGVMDSAMMQNAMQNQAVALAMVSGQNNLQSQHAIRNSRFATNSDPVGTATTSQSASLPLPGDTPSLTPTAPPVTGSVNPLASFTGATAQSINAAQTQNLSHGLSPSILQSLPQSLQSTASKQTLQNGLQSIKGLDQYRSTAQRIPPMGVSVDTSN